ncbi:MAG: hypothetical protein J0I98_14015 [Mesorhizobium sp.]|nr:hypothetical protein [Mesorhizobium sp.]MBN9243902.1 hypothetical protein [Mesorhizobium sp.]
MSGLERLPRGHLTDASGDAKRQQRLAAWSEAFDPGQTLGDEDDHAPGR